MSRPKSPDTTTPNPSRLHSRLNKGIPYLASRKSLFPLNAQSSSNTIEDPSESPSKRHELSKLDVSLSKCLVKTGVCIRHNTMGLLLLFGISFIFYMAYQLVTLSFHSPREMSSSSIQQTIVSENQPTTTQRKIILLAGPHKTGTTSIQSNLYSWTRNPDSVFFNDTERHVLLPSWYWPVPTMVSQVESNDPQNFAWTPAKGFYALLEAMRNHTLYRVEDRLLFKNYTFDQVIDMYRVELQHAWDQGYNIVLGTEAVDYCVKDVDGQGLLEQLLGILPHVDNYSPQSPSSSMLVEQPPIIQRVKQEQEMRDIKDHVTVVVTYRSPRVKHLVSIWHQTKKKVENFRAWMIATKNELGALDSLALAEMLLDNGLRVILIDSSGIIHEGYDISSVMACDVLGAECTSDKTLKELQSEPLVKNVKVDKNYNLNVEEKELDAMDKVMRQYDCKFQHLMGHPNLTVLYGHDLIDNFNTCTGSIEMSRLEMKRQLVEIIQSTEVEKN